MSGTSTVQSDGFSGSTSEGASRFAQYRSKMLADSSRCRGTEQETHGHRMAARRRAPALERPVGAGWLASRPCLCRRCEHLQLQCYRRLGLLQGEYPGYGISGVGGARSESNWLNSAMWRSVVTGAALKYRRSSILVSVRTPKE